MSKAMFYNGKYLYTAGGLLAMSADCCCVNPVTGSYECTALNVDSEGAVTGGTTSVVVQRALAADLTIAGFGNKDAHTCEFGATDCASLNATWSLSRYGAAPAPCRWDKPLAPDVFEWCCGGSATISSFVVYDGTHFRWQTTIDLQGYGVGLNIGGCVINQHLIYHSSPFVYNAVQGYWQSTGAWSLTNVYNYHDPTASPNYCDPVTGLTLDITPDPL